MKEEKYRIIYVDEEEKDRDNLAPFLSSDGQLEVVAIHPLVLESDLISYIEEQKFDAVIIDHILYGKDTTIKYSGADFVNQMREIKDKFPAFVLTRNREDNELDESLEPFLILTKEELESDTASVIKTIAGTIRHYKRANKQLQSKLQELLQKREQQHGHLDDNEIQEVINLDSEIERRLNRGRMLPDIIKESEGLKALSKTISDAQEFLDKLKNEK
jgi:DNA-binding NarL/FixJ family response regulator